MDGQLIGDHDPTTPLGDTVAMVNRAVPGIPPEHALAAAQTSDPIEAAHTIAGLNLLVSHAAHANKILEASTGPIGVQGEAGATQTGLTKGIIQGGPQAGQPFYQPVDYKNPLGGFGDWSAKEASKGWQQATQDVFAKGFEPVGGALGVVANVVDPWEWVTGHTNLQKAYQGGTQVGQGFGAGIGGAVAGTAGYINSTSNDLLALPQKFLDHPQAVLDQFRHDIANDVNGTTDFFPKLYRYYVQTVHDKGANYAAGQLLSLIATALATGGAGGAGEGAGTIAAEGEGTVASRLAGLTSRTKAAYDLYRNVADSPLGQAVGIATAPIRAGAKLNTRLGKTSAELTALAQQGAGGTDQQRWNAVSDGKTWVSPYGAGWQTIGNAIMSLMGADPKSYEGMIGADIGNLYSSLFILEPLGAVGKVFADARSLEGASGLLHSLWSGTAIRGPEDIDRIYSQYGAFRRTVNLIAESNPARLAELYKGKVPPDLLLDFGNAHSADQVLDVLKKHATSTELTSSNMLTLGGYTRTKAALQDFARAEQGLPPLVIRTPKDIVDWTIWKSTGEFKQISNYFAKTLAQRGFWIDSNTGAMMTDKILRADPASIPTILGRLRQAGEQENVIAQVGRDLLQAAKDDNHEAFINTVRNSQLTAWLGYLHASLNDPAYAADWVAAITDRSREMLDQMLGFTGIGTEGLYTRDKADSLLVDSKGDPVATAGASTAHRASVPLLSAQDMRRATKIIANLSRDEELTSLARPLAIAGRTDEVALRALRAGLQESGANLGTFLRDIRNTFAAAATLGEHATAEGDAALKLFHDSRLGKYESVWTRTAAGEGDTAEKVNQFRAWLIDQAKNSDEVGRLEAHYLSALIDTRILGRSIDPMRAFAEGSQATKAEAEAEYMSRYESLVSPYRNRGYRTSLAMTGDFIDHVINDLYFKPLTLSSPSWAWHVAASEAILNSFRYGPLHMFEARLAATFASKAEKYSLPPGVGYDHVRDAVANLLDEVNTPYLRRELREGGLTEFERLRLEEEGMSPADIKATESELRRRLGMSREDLNARQRYLTTPLARSSQPGREYLAGLTIAMRESTLKILAGEAHAERLINDAMDLRLLHPGGINPALSASHTAYVENTSHAGDFSTDKVEGKRTARWGKKFVSYDTRDFGHLNALQHFIGTTLGTPEHQFVADAFREVINSMGEDKFIAALQATRIDKVLHIREADVIKEIEAKTVRYLEALPAGERDSMLRTKYFSANAKHFSDITNPMQDFARVLVDENLNAWMNEQRDILHTPILDQIAEHNVRGVQWFKNYAKKQSMENMPSGIIGPEIFSGKAERFSPFVRLSNLSHEKMLGPMVDYISRQPTYLLAYHREMEALRNVQGVYTTTVGDALQALHDEKNLNDSEIARLSSEVGDKMRNWNDASEITRQKYYEFKDTHTALNRADADLTAAEEAQRAASERVTGAEVSHNKQRDVVAQAKAALTEAARRERVAAQTTGDITKAERQLRAVHQRFYRLDNPELVKQLPALSPEKYFAQPSPEGLLQQETDARTNLLSAQKAYEDNLAVARRGKSQAEANLRLEQRKFELAKTRLAARRAENDATIGAVAGTDKAVTAAAKSVGKIKSEIEKLHDVVSQIEDDLMAAIGRLPENQDRIANLVGRNAELNDQITNHVVQPSMLSEVEAQTLAEQRAARKMIGEVHNPADRTNFENVMKRFSPFYFAQNQAWRRAFRLLAEDPSAFEKYIKLTMGITNYAHNHTVNGIPMVELPSNMFGINLFGDLSSLKSLTPFGTSGDTSWSGLFRDTTMPALGPVGMISAEALRDGAGFVEGVSGDEQARLKIDNAFNYVEGVSAQMPLMAQLLPNTLFRNILEGVYGYTHLDAANDIMGTSYVSTRLQVYKNVTQEVLDGIGKDLLNNGFGNYNAATMRYVYRANPAMFTTYESMVFSIKAQNPAFLQNIADKANKETLALWTTKTLLGFFGPTAISLENVRGNALSAELENDIAKLGVTNGYTAFSKKHPTDLMTSVFTTAHPYGPSYAATVPAAQFIDQNPEWVQAHPQIASFFIPKGTGSGYSQNARNLELAMGLSARQNLSGLANSMRITWGNDWYYGMLVPSLEQQVTDGTMTQYKASRILKQERQAYKTANPTWSAYYDDGRSSVATASYRQLENFYNTGQTYEYEGVQLPAVTQNWSEESRLQALQIQGIMDNYDTFTKMAANATGSDLYNLETSWYNFLQGVIKKFPSLSPVVTTVFNRLPSTGVIQ